MNFKKEHRFFSSLPDGQQLYFQRWIPKNTNPRLNLVFHHGLGEHCDRYENLLSAFEQSNFTIYSFDIRGHGRSAGIRGDAKNIAQLVQDLENFLHFIKNNYKVEKPVLLGHSLGGLVAISYALKHSNQWDISALCTSGAALQIKQNLLDKVKKIFAHALHFIKPDLTLPNGLNIKHISHDLQTVEKYKKDALNHGKISVRLALDLLREGELNRKRAGKLKIPLYMAHGMADRIADHQGTVAFFKNCSSNDKKLMLYPGLYHEIFNEVAVEKKKVLHDLYCWISHRK